MGPSLPSPGEWYESPLGVLLYSTYVNGVSLNTVNNIQLNHRGNTRSMKDHSCKEEGLTAGVRSGIS